MSDILKEAIDMAEEAIAHHDEETRALKETIERLTETNHHLLCTGKDKSLEIERLTAVVNTLECDAEWCGKSPTKNDDGKCQVCKALAAVDKGES